MQIQYDGPDKLESGYRGKSVFSLPKSREVLFFFCYERYWVSHTHRMIKRGSCKV